MGALYRLRKNKLSETAILLQQEKTWAVKDGLLLHVVLSPAAGPDSKAPVVPVEPRITNICPATGSPTSFGNVTRRQVHTRGCHVLDKGLPVRSSCWDVGALGFSGGHFGAVREMVRKGLFGPCLQVICGFVCVVEHM